MENEKKPIFRHNSPLLIQQVVTPVTLHLNVIMKDLCSLTAERLSTPRLLRSAGGDRRLSGRCVRIKTLVRTVEDHDSQKWKWKQTSAKQWYGIYRWGVSLWYHCARRRCCRLNLNPAEKGQCETFREMWKDQNNDPNVLIIAQNVISFDLFIYFNFFCNNNDNIYPFAFCSAVMSQVQTGFGQRAGDDPPGDQRVRWTWVMLSSAGMLIGQIWVQEQIKEATHI